MASQEVKKVDKLAGLEDIQSFDQALAALRESGFEPKLLKEYGDGFALLKDKGSLCGIDFAILGGRVIDSDKYKDETGEFTSFVALHLITADNKKHIIVDGSSGIYRQCIALMAKRDTLTGLIVEGGLTRSDYTYVDDKGAESAATTFYLTGF